MECNACSQVCADIPKLNCKHKICPNCMSIFHNKCPICYGHIDKSEYSNVIKLRIISLLTVLNMNEKCIMLSQVEKIVNDLINSR